MEYKTFLNVGKNSWKNNNYIIIFEFKLLFEMGREWIYYYKKRIQVYQI